MVKAPLSGKVLSPSKLASLLKNRKSKKIVFTNGCFDILHVGHARYLAEARRLGDALVVAINTDASVRKLKGPGRPVNPKKARAEVLAALRSVDYVTFFAEPTPLEVIKRIKPDVLVKGGDWKKKDIVGADFVESLGGKVRSLKFVDGFSTTKTLEKLKG
jgi:D-beta-D-heptose 7-phosphate kinase/D-beta-D-heptose 1-phosphate adenosyltransferase